jgi:hypothetical protein
VAPPARCPIYCAPEAATQRPGASGETTDELNKIKYRRILLPVVVFQVLFSFCGGKYYSRHTGWWWRADQPFKSTISNRWM